MVHEGWRGPDRREDTRPGRRLRRTLDRETTESANSGRQEPVPPVSAHRRADKLVPKPHFDVEIAAEPGMGSLLSLPTDRSVGYS